MEKEILLKNEKKYTRLYAFIALLLICFYLVNELVFELWYRLAANYGLFLIVSFIALSFFLRFFSGSKEEKCIVLYAIWVLITRMLNGDIFLDREFYFLVRTVLHTGCYICIGFVLDRDDRKRFFDIVCAIVCGYWFVLAVVGLYATLNGTRIALPPADVTVGIGTVANQQLLIENAHRNVSGVWFALATILMIYQFFACRRKIWRVPIVMSAIVFYFATAMSFCRAAQIGLSAAVTMLVVLLTQERISQKKGRLKAVAIIVIVLLVFPLSYTGYGAATGVCSMISAHIVESGTDAQPPVHNTEVTAQDEAAQALENMIIDAQGSNSTVKKPIFAESRGKSNIMQLGGRAHVWKAGILTLIEEPERLIRGGMLGEYMEKVMEFAREITDGEYKDQNSQMHNFILDSLLLAGLPGAFILVVFTVFLVIRMIKVFFSGDDNVPLQLRLLTLPITFLLIDNMMEAHIFRYDMMPSILFFFISGVFLAWSYELIPSSKR